MKKINLCGVWSVKASDGREFTARVPGCVHTDIFDTDELFRDKNSLKSTALESLDWTYKKIFFNEYKDTTGATLVFEGIDTYATIFLNGFRLLETENMFIPHRIAVDKYLVYGENILEVKIESPVEKVKGMPEGEAAFSNGRLNTRRIQCTYGWDWVDRFVTCGIYKSAYVEFDNVMHVEDVYAYTSHIDSYGAEIQILTTMKNYSGGAIVTTEIFDENQELVIKKTEYCEEELLKNVFSVENPKLWYPSGYGSQPLYTLRITIGQEIFETKFGIRTVRVLQHQDKEGSTEEKISKRLRATASGKEYDLNDTSSCFILLVNGKKIFCTGANWVPCEPFPSAEAPEKITECLTIAKNSGINMVRVWGGGIFEQEHFYSECDRLGIMVTQDFLMACGTYPEDEEWFRKNLEKEAVFAAKYLRNHPCLMWWSGDNENAIRGSDEDVKYPGRISARKIIAPALAKYDYSRPFFYSSPYGGKKYASKTVGTTHNTQFLEHFFAYVTKQDGSFGDYMEDYLARFVAEEPVIGAVSDLSLKKFISEEYRENEDMWMFHTKTNPYLELHLFEYIRILAKKVLGEFRDDSDKFFKYRYIQYEWVRLSLTLTRRNLWYSSGIVYWMLNDCWPASAGWSLIDYYNTPKAGYYAIKHYSENVALILQENAVYISNINETAPGELTVYSINLSNNEKTEILKNEIVAENGVTKIPFTIDEKEKCVVVARLCRKAGCVSDFYSTCGTILSERFEALSSVTDDAVTVTAGKYVHCVELTGAEYFEDNYFSLLPGEEKTVRFKRQKEKIIASGYGLKI